MKKDNSWKIIRYPTILIHLYHIYIYVYLDLQKAEQPQKAVIMHTGEDVGKYIYHIYIYHLVI